MDNFYNEIREILDNQPKKAAKDIMLDRDASFTQNSYFFQVQKL